MAPTCFGRSPPSGSSHLDSSELIATHNSAYNDMHMNVQIMLKFTF